MSETKNNLVTTIAPAPMTLAAAREKLKGGRQEVLAQCG